jgi:3'(2'), 5'-bisphosphate nucleotidase
MNESLESVLEVVRRGAILAAAVTRRVQAEDTLSALAKGHDDPVTVADYASQALVLREVSSAFPRIAIISEEASEHLRAQQSASVLERTRSLVSEAIGESITHDRLCSWIDHSGDPTHELALTIDPIDGTKGFLRRQHYAIAIGIVRRGRPIGGVLVCPRLAAPGGAEGVVLTALAGGGAFEGPIDGGATRRIRVNAGSDPAAARVLASVEASHGDPKLVDDLIATLGLGDKVRIDSQVKYAVLARGEAEIYFRPRSKPSYRDHVWDHAGGVAIAIEAGATVTDQDGKALDFGRGSRLEDNRGVLATHGPLHDSIVATLARLEAQTRT